MTTEQVITGSVKVKGVPDTACFTTFPELLKSLGSYLSVEIQNQQFSNIVISNQQPGQADRNKIWWRLSNAGSFVGIFFYSNGDWAQIFPAPQEIFWLYGDSANPPPGFSFDLVQTLFSVPNYAQLIALAVPNGGVPPFVYYPAVYVGL